MASSSFQRKMKPKLPEIAGVSPSLFTNQLLVSTGVPDLDILLGGGLVIGSVLVISEDFSGNFSRLMLKYFLSEGVVHKHSLLVTNSSPDCKILTQNLPSFEFNTNNSASAGDTAANDEKMMIAWRYQGQNTTKDTNINISNVNNSEHTFNLLKTVPSEVLDRCDISVCDIESDSDDDQWVNSSYCKVIKQIQDKIKSGGFLIDPTEPGDHTNILRIGIQSLGLSLWGDLQHQQKHLPMFLYCLRSLLRSCFGVAVITIPATVLRNVKNILHFDTDGSNNERLLDSIKLLSDYCLSLQSFEGDEKVNEVYKDYHGLLNILKIQSIGSLGPPNQLIQDPSQLVFKSKRTKFVIEKFHLPPDLSETVSRDNKDKTLKAKDIDF